MKPLKHAVSLTILGIVLMYCGIWLLFVQHKPSPLINGLLGLLCGIIGLLVLAYVWIDNTNQPTIYRFIHCYKHSNILDNTTTVEKLRHKDLAQLKKFDEGILDFFKNHHINIESAIRSPEGGVEGQTCVWGYIVASNKAEAIRNLHYTTDWDYMMTQQSVKYVPNLK
jgi:hypothetical protein